MFPIACYQATGQYFAHSALNDRFPAILNAQNPAIPSAHPQTRYNYSQIQYIVSHVHVFKNQKTDYKN